MPLIDLSNAVFNSGFEADATLTINSVASTVDAIWLSEYQLNQTLGIDYSGEEPAVAVKSSLVSSAVRQRDTITMSGKNGGSAMKIRDIKDLNNGVSILVLQYD
jgi:hypothetical protein